MKKRLLTVLFSSAFIVGMGSSAVYAEEADITNENGIEFTEENIQSLQSLGFSKDEIVTMDQEEWELNKGLSGEVVSEDTNYYRVTEDLPEGYEEEKDYVGDAAKAESKSSIAATKESQEDDFKSTTEEITKEEYEEGVAKEKLNDGFTTMLRRLLVHPTKL